MSAIFLKITVNLAFFISLFQTGITTKKGGFMGTTRGTRSSVFSKSAISISLSLLMSSAAVAESQEMEEVVVTGKSIKASQMAAIDAKRMADNVADVISADAIGRFPDQNLADALGRVPGVAIERDQGQARYIAFRGSPKRYTTTAFNGIDIPGVENGRTPRFDAYPAVITSQVVANKAITRHARRIDFGLYRC